MGITKHPNLHQLYEAYHPLKKGEVFGEQAISTPRKEEGFEELPFFDWRYVGYADCTTEKACKKITGVTS
jgi:hypothetical protein